jgi:pyruvate,orthophosphate dikinase
VFTSWNTDRARLYRRRERIPHDLGTAVNICTMVFGNLGDDSGTGVCFTRDPSTGKAGAYGDYLVNAQGEDVVSGIRNTLSLDDFASVDPQSSAELRRIMRRLETHYRDLCDIEFTVERGKLWMLQTRVGKRTPAAAFRIATQLVDEQLITTDEALERVGGPQLARDGVGRLVALATTEGRATKPGLQVGVCGEHGGDPDSIHFFHTAGLDDVSCSPFRVPVACLEAGCAVLGRAEEDNSDDPDIQRAQETPV